MDLPEIPPFRKKVLSPQCHDSDGSAAPSSTMAPPPPCCDDVFSGVPTATPGLPTANLPHEAPPTLPDTPPATLPLESLPDVHQQIQETVEQELAPFVPSMGAWSKPLVLKFPPPSTPPEPSTPRSYDFQLVQSQIENFWPSLEEGTNLKQKKSLLKGAPPSLPNLPVSKLPPPDLKEDGSLRFPWAARMNPASRNLFRASRPTFRLDGTPEIIIPTKPHHSPSQSGGSETSSEPQGATSPQDSSIAFEHLFPSAKSTSASTLAGSPSAHTTPAQVMDNVPSAIISNEG
ncbi:unnamed protein product, partial [Brassica rapa]